MKNLNKNEAGVLMEAASFLDSHNDEMHFARLVMNGIDDEGPRIRLYFEKSSDAESYRNTVKKLVEADSSKTHLWQILVMSTSVETLSPTPSTPQYILTFPKCRFHGQPIPAEPR